MLRLCSSERPACECSLDSIAETTEATTPKQSEPIHHGKNYAHKLKLRVPLFGRERRADTNGSVTNGEVAPPQIWAKDETTAANR